MQQNLKTLGLAALLALGTASPTLAGTAEQIAAATAEGAVSIYTATDIAQGQALIDAFKAKYPGITINYNDVGTNGAYNRVISEAAAGQVGGDIIWTSAMDLTVKLAADGYLATYASTEKPSLPAWADYKNMVYATSVEPIGILYNKNALKADQVPKTRADLIAFVANPAMAGKVASFDPEKSGVGFMIDVNDLQQTTTFWDLAKAFRAGGGKTYSASGAMKETVMSGENVLAFNIIGSYALAWAKDNDSLGVAFGTDYTAALSRVAAIIKGAPHPEAAKLFLDFMLSKEGQTALASVGLPSLRTDVDSGYNLTTIGAVVGGNLKPIALDDTLLEYMEPAKRVKFLKMWADSK